MRSWLMAGLKVATVGLALSVMLFLVLTAQERAAARAATSDQRATRPAPESNAAPSETEDSAQSSPAAPAPDSSAPGPDFLSSSKVLVLDPPETLELDSAQFLFSSKAGPPPTLLEPPSAAAVGDVFLSTSKSLAPGTLLPVTDAPSEARKQP